MTLPNVLKLAKNEIASVYPWLFLLDVVTPDGRLYYLVHNNEDVVFQGRTYTRFPFQLELPEINSEGAVPSWNIKVINTARTLEKSLQETKGMTDSVITLRVVNAGYLEEDHVDLETEIKVLEAFSDAFWITWRCGGRNLFRDLWPMHRYLANYCTQKFKWHECYYNDPTASVVLGDDGNDYICYFNHVSGQDTRPVSGSRWMQVWRRKDRANTGGAGGAWQDRLAYTAGTETCKQTLVDCRAKANSRRFRGFIGLAGTGVKIV